MNGKIELAMQYASDLADYLRLHPTHPELPEAGESGLNKRKADAIWQILLELHRGSASTDLAFRAPMVDRSSPNKDLCVCIMNPPAYDGRRLMINYMAAKTPNTAPT